MSYFRFAFLLPVCAYGAAQVLATLPNGAVTKSIQLDSAGNIYAAGVFNPTPQDSTAPGHAFVAKLSPDGSKILWQTNLAGSKNDSIQALALDSTNAVYVTGTTSSPDFPTTAGSLQPTGITPQAFAAKLSPTGAVVYATYIGGTVSTTGQAIAVDSASRAFITGTMQGTSAFPTTPGAVVGSTNTNLTSAWIVELDPTGGKALLSISGFGGSAITVDSQSNIYAAGAFTGQLAPTTAGAFQSAALTLECASLGFFGGFLCGDQHVAKIDPTGTQLLYATYVTGTWGAAPNAIAVDASGNVILAGTTNSPSYPTTPGAYQPEYFASPYTQFAGKNIGAPPSAGFVTKLNATGTGLVWSTFLQGTGGPAGENTVGDSVTGMALDANGNILVTGLAQSKDFPGLWTTPVAARPGVGGLDFVARLSPDGVALSPTQLLPSSYPALPIAVRADGTAVVGGSQIVSASLFNTGHVAAISDSADNAKIVAVAPGQLLTLYGTDIAPSPNGVTVTFNGIPTPILYTSGIQINVQVPFEIAAIGEVTMQVSSQSAASPFTESFILSVVARQPSVFLAPSNFTGSQFGVQQCNGVTIPGTYVQPLALNSDGTINSCANPAVNYFDVTLFMNGLGITSPTLSTGAIVTSAIPLAPAASISPEVVSTVGGPNQNPSIMSTSTNPGSISGLAAVTAQFATALPYESFPISVGGILARQQNVVVWVKQ